MIKRRTPPLTRSRQPYGWRLLLALDQLLNVLLSPVLNLALDEEHKAHRRALFGFEDETLSSVFGKNAQHVKWCRAMCYALNWIDNNHCKKSIEADEGDYEEGQKGG